MIESCFRQLWLEIRRNEYRWLFLVVTVGISLVMTDRLSAPAVFWTDVTIAWRDSLYVLGPWAAGAAAWSAGRERRHGLDDLLLTTPRSPFRRRIWSLTAVCVLSVLGFLLIGGWLALSSMQRIAWSHLDWGVIVVALMAIVASAIFGFALGVWKSRRATPLATMIGFLLLQLILADANGWQRFLTATPRVRNSPWSGISPGLTGEQFFLFAGLIVLGLTLIATVSGWNWLYRGALAGSAIVIVVAVSALVGQGDAIRADAANAAGAFDAPPTGSYVMTCSDGETVVCVHPGFRPLLDEASNQLNALIVALGSPAGSPTRIELVPAVASSNDPGVWSHLLRSVDPAADLQRAIHDLARTLIAPTSTTTNAAAQNSVLAWALIEAGQPFACTGDEVVDSGTSIEPVDCDAVNRLLAMSPEDLATWLSVHWSAIQNGTITVADIP